jgi:two-component system sensor histidine kinase AtoS
MTADLTNSLLSELSRSDLLKMIGDICNAVNAATDKHELLDISLRKTMKMFNAGRGSIFIANEEGTKLILEVAYGMGNIEKERLEKQMGEGIVGQVAVAKQPIVVEDIAADERFKGYKNRQNYRTRSFICAPLLIKDHLIGVINIADKETGTFDQHELQLLDFLVTQIALNFRRIELYHKFRTIVKETQSLKNKLGEKQEETLSLKQQIDVQEKFAIIGKLAGGIAHEFNNPLDGVLRYTNLCLEHMNDEVVRGYLLEIRNGLNRMAAIVRNLIACSRNEFPEREFVDLQLAINYALKSIQLECSHKKVQVVSSIQPDIPLLPDRGLERILVNLMRNAVQACPEEGRIDIIAKCIDSVLTIVIKDNGHGISEENMNKIFEPFFTTKDKSQGCGLGLTVVAEIVKGYEGRLDVESKVNNGTTFTVNIPVKKEL